MWRPERPWVSGWQQIELRVWICTSEVSLNFGWQSNWCPVTGNNIVWFIQSSYKRNCSVNKKVFSASNSNTPCLWPISYTRTLQQAFIVCVAYKMKSGSNNILSLERETFHFRRLKMKSTLLLLAALATCSVFCKPSIEDNSIFNIHASLLSIESADDEEGGDNRWVLVFLVLCVLEFNQTPHIDDCLIFTTKMLSSILQSQFQV